MSDLIRKRDAVSAISDLLMILDGKKPTWNEVYHAIQDLPSAEPEQKTGEWIPFTMRELTDEEREENPEWDWVFTCKLPADGETVLLTNGKYVWEDMFCCDDGCYFDKADDIEDYDGYAWMPLPEPYRGDQ